MALVIGNGRYQHNATLVNPPNDAADMAAALKKDGFTVTLLTDASRKDMEQAVRAFGNSLKNPDAVGMFYYSGHGAQADGENFLIPVDADIQAADGQDITQMMKRVTSRVKTDTNGKQTPWVSTNLTKDFAFKSASGSTIESSAQPAAAPTISVTRLYGSLVVHSDD